MIDLPPETVRRLQEEFQNCPEIGPVGFGASDQKIQALEKEVGATFSVAYRQFLRAIGSGIVGHLPIYGANPIAMYPADGTVSDVTTRFREQGWLVTDRGPVISMDQAGNPIVEDSDGRIVTFDHDAGGVHEVALSFRAFISSLMDR